MAEGKPNLNGSLRAHASACVAAGLCALPALRRGDEKRVALRAWKPYQKRLPTDQELGSWFSPAGEDVVADEAMLGQLTLSALDSVGPTLGGVPVVGPALPALTGIVGLFIGSARLRKEKEASFNKGLKEGRTLADGGGAAA